MQTKAQARTELNLYYKARASIAEGKSFTFANEAGTRVMTHENLPYINDQITRLERRVSTPEGQTHNVAVANFNTR